jgi:UDP-N-acetylmuramoyl-tripeptide--D-alanyl-D-alanine ligase
VRLRASAIAAATGGRVHGPDVDVDGATIDSRAVHAGNLFVPVVAARDGHDFVDDALDRGAAAYLTARPPSHRRGTAIEVDDTSRALLALGAAVRQTFATGTEVIGITGSVGKTSVKDLTAAAAGASKRVAASPRSFNNELGVPLTLLDAPDGVEVFVVEMGARGRGHIDTLCAVARPTIGVVTEVVLAHTELFGTIDDVAAAKGELVEALPSEGAAVLNADNPYVAAMADRTNATVVTYGRAGDVTAHDIALDDDLRARFVVRSPWGSADVRLGVAGAHQVANALAALSAAAAAGVPLDAAADAIAGARLSPWRMEVHRTATGLVVVNDAYNANPTSTEAALHALAALPARRRIAVLGVMAELGAVSDSEHRRIAVLAGELGIEVLAVAAPEYGATTVDGVDAARAALGELGGGDAVLVKGSRVAGLERLAEALLA